MQNHMESFHKLLQSGTDHDHAHSLLDDPEEMVRPRRPPLLW